MHRKSWSLVAVAALGLAASSVFAGHNEPPKAAYLKGQMLTAYIPCTAPNDSTVLSSTPLPACNPAVRSNPGCGFGIKGSGKFSASVKGSDVALSMTLAGLETPACDGKVFKLRVDLTGLTTDDCIGSPCTVADIIPYEVPGISCTVAAGKCAIKTTVNTAFPGTLVPGVHTGLALGRITLYEGSNLSFQSGLFVP